MKRIREILTNRTVIWILGAYCLFAAVLLGTTISGMKGFPEEFQAVDFKLRDLFGGEDLTLSAHSGQPVIIYFFASW